MKDVSEADAATASKDEKISVHASPLVGEKTFIMRDIQASSQAWADGSSGAKRR